jgi:hypothetical protein
MPPITQGITIMKLPQIIKNSNGFWYAQVSNTTNQEWLVSGKNGIEKQIPSILTFVGSEKIYVVNKLINHFQSLKG